MRRTIADDRLQFTLNGKPVERIEIKSLLDLLGFSKSYPYCFYIKPCNIQEIIDADDARLLTIFQQIVGFDDFAQSKERGLRSLGETRDELEIVTNMLEKINVQLHITTADWNRSDYKRCLDKRQELRYLIKKRHLEGLQREFDQIKHHYTSLTNRKTELSNSIANFTREIKQRRTLLKEIADKKLQLTNEQSGLTETKDKLTSNRSNLQATIQTLQNQIDRDKNQKDLATEEKVFVETAIKLKEDEIKGIEVEYERCRELKQRFANELEAANEEYVNLFQNACAAEGWNCVFYSTEERDGCINNRLAAVEAQLRQGNVDSINLTNQLESDQRGLDEANEQLGQFDGVDGEPNEEKEWVEQEQAIKQEIEELGNEQRYLLFGIL